MRPINAHDLWKEIMMLPHNGDMISSEEVEKAILEAPTVDAEILPCKIGDDVYIIPSKVNFRLNVLNGYEENNRIYHQKVYSITFTERGWYVMGSADHEYGTGGLLLDRFYKETWFLTREEAEAALDKMKGGAMCAEDFTI